MSVNMVQRYTGVQIPDELADRVKRIVEERRLGYRSFAEFITDAVRRRIEELEQAERMARSVGLVNIEKGKEEIDKEK